MNPDATQIKNLLAAKPFRPFWLETTGGSLIRVARAEWLLEPPEAGGTFVVFNQDRSYSILAYADLTENITVETKQSPET
jgi:hypothetical protein